MPKPPESVLKNAVTLSVKFKRHYSGLDWLIVIFFFASFYGPPSGTYTPDEKTIEECLQEMRGKGFTLLSRFDDPLNLKTILKFEKQ